MTRPESNDVIVRAAFPAAYATLLSAFCLPLLVMLAGLILRGVAFEYRNKTERMRWIWDLSFIGGSFAAAFIQGDRTAAISMSGSHVDLKALL
jgi:cytochrome d ubiquinol oxidase subunit II